MNLGEFESVEAILRSLDQRASLQSRLEVLEALIIYLHGPMNSADGFPSEEIGKLKLPLPLSWWMQFAGKRQSVFSFQNCLFPEGTKSHRGKRFVFYCENQGVYEWSLTPDNEDPEVWGRLNEDGVPWKKEGMRLSEFLISACLFEGIMQSPYQASAAWVNLQLVDKISKELPELPLLPWHWPSFPSRFHAHKGVFMVAAPNCCADEDSAVAHRTVRAGSKIPGALNMLSPFVDKAWEIFEPE